MAEAPAGLVPPKFNIDQPRFKQILKKHIVKAQLSADGTRAPTGGERVSFSQQPTPWTSLSPPLNSTKQRLKEFLSDIQSILVSQDTVAKYRKGELNHLSEDEIWSAKHLYDSAYHPDTGEAEPPDLSLHILDVILNMSEYFE